MPKGKEKAPLGQIRRRTGRAVLLDGERTRPYYLGSLVNIGRGEKELDMIPSVKTPGETAKVVDTGART